MTRISYTANNGETGWFELEKATLIAEDVTEWDGHNRISRATASQWKRQDLYRTAGGVWMIHYGNRDGRDAPVGDGWFSLTPEGAQQWLRQQDLHEIADEHFGHIEEHNPLAASSGPEELTTEQRAAVQGVLDAHGHFLQTGDLDALRDALTAASDADVYHLALAAVARRPMAAEGQR